MATDANNDYDAFRGPFNRTTIEPHKLFAVGSKLDKDLWPNDSGD
jgi:hypothetical protein